MNYPELAYDERKRLWGRLSIRLVVIISAIVFIVFVFPPLFRNFFPFIAALFMAWLFHPIIRKIQEKIRVSRKILSFALSLLFFLIAGALITWLFYAIICEIGSFIQSWSSGGFDLSGFVSSDNLISDILAALPEGISASVQSAFAQIVEWLKGAMSTAVAGITSKAGGFIAGIPSFFIALVVFLMSTYFISADYPNLKLFVGKRFSGELRKAIEFIRNSTLAAFGAYLRAQLLLSLGVFFILLIGFLLIGQPYALLLAFLLAVVDFIPVVGSGTILVPWALIAMITGNYVFAIQLAVIWGVVVLYRRLLEPKVVGAQTGLSPLLSLASIYIGMQVAGVAGMVLGPIVLQVLIKICEAGAFSGLIADGKMLVKDCMGILQNKPENN